MFIDGRADTVYGDDVLRRYLAIDSVDAGWREQLAESGAELTLLAPDSPLTRALDAEDVWRRVYLDDVAVIFERR